MSIKLMQTYSRLCVSRLDILGFLSSKQAITLDLNPTACVTCILFKILDLIAVLPENEIRLEYITVTDASI